MSISIIKPGLLDTIQDMGRYGFSHWGVNVGGVMDRFAASVANMLVGNCKDEPVLEIHFPGPQILFEQNALISITGADFTATLNEEALPLWKPVVVRKNTVLQFSKLNYGARCYIAIHGGPYADKWLNSYSTNLKAAAGGKDGRPLRKGDEIHFKENTIYFAGLLNSDANFRALPWSADNTKIYYHPHEISVIVGKEWNELERSSQENFIDNNFMIHPSSDRMGYQLKGSPMLLKNSFDLISSGVDFGTIQLLPDGQLIILMADHQTTGGYPRIAHVISAHLPKLAQLRPSDCVKFNIVSIEAAEEMLFARQKELQVLHRACSDHLNALVC